MSQRVSLSTVREMTRRGEKITMLTAYDATFATLLDQSGVDVILVGDSLGNVIQGRSTTLPVTVADMAYHTACVARGTANKLIVVDMPALSYNTGLQAADNARALLAAGGHMVKLEGAGPVVEIVQFLTERGVAVCGHLGLTPQSVHKLGGFKVQGRQTDAADQLLADAVAIEQAGADMLILECVPTALGGLVSAQLSIPVVGIGAGPDCDGQVLVLYDALGLGSGHSARFVRNFCADGLDVRSGIEGFVNAVRDGSYPAQEHCYE